MLQIRPGLDDEEGKVVSLFDVITMMINDVQGMDTQHGKLQYIIVPNAGSNLGMLWIAMVC